MFRCIDLARQGAGNVAPNPMVGAVLVHGDKIIGEGWHRQYGQAHAEVNCLASVKEADRHLIPNSDLYVNLEPCAHFGKTPPCTELIISNRIPRVIIGSRDPFKQVDGKGIEKLQSTGVEVINGILEDECRQLNERFFTFQESHRPYIVLKWAQSADGKMANINGERLLISNEYSNRLVHKWRGEEASILVGTNTALMDDPQLTNRLWPGPSPIRLVVDMKLRLPVSLKIFNQEARTIIFNAVRYEENGNVLYYQLTEDVSVVAQIIHALYRLNIQSVLVEGGAQLLQSFIDEGSWDEARVITNTSLMVKNGLPAPRLENFMMESEQKQQSDNITIYRPQKPIVPHS